MSQATPRTCGMLLESLESRLLLSNFFIATNGSDSGAGTLAAPFASLGHFLAVAKPGDNTFIEGGTYNGSSSGWGGLEPTISGTAAAPITIQNYNGQKVTIDTGTAGSGTTFMYLDNSNKYINISELNLNNFHTGFKLYGDSASPSFINFSNLNITNCGVYAGNEGDAWGIAMFNGTHDITINATNISRVDGPGILFQGNVTNLLIENTNSFDNSDGQGSDGDADGITGDVDGNYYPQNVTLINDRAYDNNEDGFDIKGVNVTETGLAAWGQVACDYKAWSPPNVQGSFTITNCVGYDAGETVFRGRRSPNLTITNSSFLGTGTGESTFIYDTGGGQAWAGNLTLSNDSFYYNGTTSYAYAADIDKSTAVVKMDSDRFYNSNNVNQAVVMRSGSSSFASYGNAAFNNGSFYSAEGQEQHGQGVQQDIAPFLVTTSIPSTSNAGVATSFAATAQDPESNPLTYSWSFGDGTAAAGGASVTHVFASGGIFDVILTVSDGTAQTILDPLVTVLGGSGSLPPVAKDDSATTNVNKAVTTPNVLANDSDPNAQALTITAFTQAAHGTVVKNSNGTFSYTPASNWIGTDAFTYTISDTCGLTAKANVSVVVAPLPPVAKNDSATTNVNKAVTTPKVLANDSDPNGQALTITAFTQAAHGTVVKNSNGTFTYTPASNWIGTDAFTYTIRDTSGLTAKASVSIVVSPVNYYIATNGSDSAAGTLAAPFASLGHFLAIAKPGYNAYIEGGTYNGSSSGWGNLSPTVSGTATAPITIGNYNGQKVTINTGTAGSSTTFMYLDNGNKYLNIQGLYLVNFKVGFKLFGTATTAPSFINFTGLNISYCGLWGTTQVDGAWGIAMFSGTHDITISYSHINHVAGPGILFQGDVRNVLIQNTTSYDNNDGLGTNGDADGITGDVDGNLYPQNITLINDQAYGNSEDGFDIKGVSVTETNLTAWGQGACDYKVWSPTNVQGSFTLTNCIGYDAGESVLRSSRAPQLTITNSSFVNSGTGETTFSYDGGQTWGGQLTLQGDKFYYDGTTSYAVAADIQMQNASLNMNSDQYYNANRTDATVIMRNGTASTTYGNAAFNTSSFDLAVGQELNGQGVQQGIAPFFVGHTLPATAVRGAKACFSIAAQDPQNSSLTYTWSFGDGTASVLGASVTHAFAAIGTYTVKCTVSNGVLTTTWVQTITVA